MICGLWAEFWWSGRVLTYFLHAELVAVGADLGLVGDAVIAGVEYQAEALVAL